MKQVLIITYYWPPSSGVGVQRWLKFAKYLPQYGWKPVIFTPENPDFNLKDEGLKAEIAPETEELRFPIWEPFQIFDKLTGGKNKKNVQQGLVLEKSRKNWKDDLFIWIRGNLFIPDPRVFWVKPSVKFLKEWLMDHHIDLIVTTGPPHSVHLIGYHLKKKFDLPWLADFRDPWSEWDILDKLKVNKLARTFHRRLEKKVLSTADLTTTVSTNLAKQFRELHARSVVHIKNGFDDSDIPATDKALPQDKFTIGYFGLLNELRNPPALWDAINNAIDEKFIPPTEFELHLGGIISDSIQFDLQNKFPLNECLKFFPYQSQKQVYQSYLGCHLLLIILNQTGNAKWIIPAKLFEYLATGRKVMLIGPTNSDAADIIREQQAGQIHSFDDSIGIKSSLVDLYTQFKTGKLQPENYQLEKYSRRSLTQELAGHMEGLLEKERSS